MEKKVYKEHISDETIECQNKILKLLDENNLDYEGLKKLLDDFKGLQKEMQLYSRAFLKAVDVIIQSSKGQLIDTLIKQAEEDLTKNK